MPGQKKGQYNLADVDSSTSTPAQQQGPGWATTGDQTQAPIGQYSLSDVDPQTARTLELEQNPNMTSVQVDAAKQGQLENDPAKVLGGGLVPGRKIVNGLAWLGGYRGPKNPSDVDATGEVEHEADRRQAQGLPRGIPGMILDAGGVASDFTSPGNLVLMGAGAATKGLSASSRLYKALKMGQGASAGYYGVRGAGDAIGAAADSDLQPSERLQRILMGTAGAVGGAAGVSDTFPKPSGMVPLGDTMIKPRGNMPAESATPQELRQYAADNNIPVNAAQITEHNFPRNLQKVGERASVGGTAVKRQTQDAQGAISNHVDSLLDQMSPSAQTPNTAASGQVLKQNIEDGLARAKDAAEKNFNEVDLRAKNAGVVDFRPLKQLADGMFSDSDFLRQNAKTMDPRRASGLLREVMNMPDSGTFGQAQKLRSALLDEARHPDNVVSDSAQAWIKQLSGATDEVMMNAASKTPGLESTFRLANLQWQNIVNDFNSPRSPLYQALKEPMPEKVPQKFLQRGSTGGSPTTIDLLDRYGIDKSPLKRELLGDLAENGFKLDARKKLGGYDDDFLNRLYSPQELDHVYKTGALARSVEMPSNPSKTSDVMTAADQAQKPIRSLVGKTLPANLTMSQRFNDFLMRSPRSVPPATSPALAPGQVAAAMNAAARQKNYQDAQRYLQSLP